MTTVLAKPMASEWKMVQIKDCLQLQNGYPFKPTQWTKSGLPIIRIQNLNNPNAPFNFCNEDIPSKFRVKNGDLLFAWSGTPGTSFGAHIWKGKDAWLNQHIFRVEFDDKLFNKEFLQLAINDNLREYIGQAHGGAGLAHITKKKFDASFLKCPPLAVQEAIVQSINCTLPRVSAARDGVERAKVMLRKFRQAVLEMGCSGLLTHSGFEDGELPRDWSLVTLEMIAPKGSIFDGPFGSNLKTADYTSEGVRVIRLENIGQLKFFGEKETYISKKKYQSLTRHTVCEGDVIFSSFIDENIRVCMLPKLQTTAIAKADCFC